MLGKINENSNAVEELKTKCDRIQPSINFMFDISNTANFLEEIGVKWWQDLNLRCPLSSCAEAERLTIR